MVNQEIPSRKFVETDIVAVAVYTNQALVTRRGAIKLYGTEQELIISQLPETIETESVRVNGKGNLAVRLLGVNVERIYTTESVVARISQLNQQIEELEAQKRQFQAQMDALALQSRFLEGLREKTEEQFSISLARKSISLSETLDLLNFLGSQYTEYAISMEDYKNQQRELDSQLEVLHASLQQIRSPQPSVSFNLTVGIEALGAGEFELEVSYVVNRASWKPLYDIRVDPKNQSVNLIYLAQIVQNTGEDWTNVNLTLSTAKPGSGTLPPKPQPWYIDIPQPLMNRKRVRGFADASMAAQSPNFDVEEENYISEIQELEKEIIQAEVITAEVSQEGNVVTFNLDGSGNIPSDGAPHKTTIFQDDYPCNFGYIAMPRLVSFAYLQANVKNNSQGTLLPGKANIFRERIFVGVSDLQNIVPGEEFKLNLGIDEGLKIERDLVEREVDKKFIGNISKITYGYKLQISNLLDNEAKLELIEQLPVSRNEQIKVRLNRTNPQIQPGEMGILKWNLTLAPQDKQEIYYQFTVEYPPQLTVIGLDV
ncbi:MAG: mucoidy inhibitor MuiA family protein [Richelia sp. SL_2_1]|nr:mucoidy inhibitor MuiA family protein [Richelia sp. SM2_1_7]NJM19205.1 mucoidy inhibitor MuiA family protein [Richelia sp. SM1_7_0]NJN11510.1 mucoidy inhibitor MuiA family protein [Richelia sp. RM1_1_1]NJO28623.1 mucoidy inhibitor MuiA family protein [Richelia sp. SL_2_1]